MIPLKIGVSERKEKENIYSASELVQIEVFLVYSKDSKWANWFPPSAPFRIQDLDEKLLCKEKRGNKKRKREEARVLMVSDQMWLFGDSRHDSLESSRPKERVSDREWKINKLCFIHKQSISPSIDVHVLPYRTTQLFPIKKCPPPFRKIIRQHLHS